MWRIGTNLVCGVESLIYESRDCHCDNCIVGCNPREWCMIKEAEE